MLATVISKSIFRKYDIRGIYNDTLTLDVAHKIGCAFAHKIREFKKENKLEGDLTVAVGMDGRLSSPKLKEHLIKGLTDCGVNVIDIGLSATPMLYYSTMTMDVIAGINITGSHNPPQYNGFKFVLNKKPFFGDDVTELYDIINQGWHHPASTSKGKLTKQNINDDFINAIITKSKTPEGTQTNLKCVWDPGNGVVGNILPQLTAKLAGTHNIINQEVDGNFPNHHPDPVLEENLQQIRNHLLQNNCDLGFAFDGDGDRLTVIDKEGNIIYGEKLLLIFAHDLLKRHPNAKIIVDVKTSSKITDLIKKWGGEPIMWKTGHSFIKNKMHLDNALLAGEMSGHLFFKENYYGFDDAIFASLMLIRIYTENPNVFNEVFGQLTDSVSTSEIRLKACDIEKFQIIENVKAHLQKNNTFFLDLDGIRYENENSWWLMRASNTEDCIIIRVEASNKNELNANIALINKLIEENSNITGRLKLVC